MGRRQEERRRASRGCKAEALVVAVVSIRTLAPYFHFAPILLGALLLVSGLLLQHGRIARALVYVGFLFLCVFPFTYQERRYIECLVHKQYAPFAMCRR
jgi:phosphoglycerol transferase MdoB-like AlkP superfamily enzyme